MLKGTRTAVRRAKKLRREMTLPEIILWNALRARPGGHKFRHQHPAGEYDLDFYCDTAKLCIEVDGEAHERGDRPERDARRDAWLEAHGIRTMRVPARDVLRNLEGVILGLLHEIGDVRPSARRISPPCLCLGEEHL
jgi:very-short-patch-repair endonuclease